ncbi:hypothetical protein [Mesorhizobium sp.]|uniref:hypothetical protein n=1 Tax=Mesorhizobium sp. TaxID=1871066 RepID=UPI000FE5DDF8|nr:hypothetical protein [Mesorhizobium sp.]RWO22183.1 MAG: hypothetical protein EOS09_21335 [Mesorhizobium sp.]
MTAPNAYIFAAAPHWQRCLTAGFDVSRDGPLSVIDRLGDRATLIGPAENAAKVAADHLGKPLWLSGGEVRWLEELDGTVRSVQAGATLSGATRLLMDARWLWALSGNAVARFDRASLQIDRLTTAAQIAAQAGEPEEGNPCILDIAMDGREGVWLLMRGTPGRLMRLDCRGCVADTLPLPCGAEHADQIAVTDGGAHIALLSTEDQLLVILRSDDGAAARKLRLWDWHACWRAERLAGNGRGRLALAGVTQDASHIVFRMDRSGEIIDGPIAPLTADDYGAGELRVNDIAVDRDHAWLAATTGLHCLKAVESGGAAQARATLLTPLLHSPPGHGGRGWLRAELDAELPQGASIKASFVTTNDPRLAANVQAVEANPDLTQNVRVERIWSLLGDGNTPNVTFAVNAGASQTRETQTFAVPLFDTQDAWLALRLEIVSPPKGKRPALKELRVLYPERSLMSDLPAIFRTLENDPERLLRRVVGVIETTTQQIDRRIAGIGRHIDPNSAPADWLDYLGSWLGLPGHPGLDEWSKREILDSAGFLLGWRGSKAGLLELARCLAGEGGSVKVLDVMAERTVIRLGGQGRSGAPVNGLLAGRPPYTAALGAKAVLGQARFAYAGEVPKPTDVLVPTVLVHIESSAAMVARNRPYADSVLAQYLPAGVRHRINWTATAAPRTADDVDALILDDIGPGAVGENAELGRTVLGGAPRTRLAEGLDMGTQLR